MAMCLVALVRMLVIGGAIPPVIPHSLIALALMAALAVPYSLWGVAFELAKQPSNQRLERS